MQGKKIPPDITEPTHCIIYLKATSKDLRRCLLLQRKKHKCKSTKNMKNQGNIPSPKNNISSVTEMKDTNFCHPGDKQFKIVV